jgi:alkanesulfonate monooxygenase SsuD/methylene tetrahydromethanopterin reductase-like flavin-dependent oxidoreductase (luciferase family)
LRIGLQVPRFTWPDAPGSIGPKLAEIGKSADEAGFASIWVMDHFFQIGAVGEVEEPILEGYSALNYLAGITRQVKLGTLVTGVHYRYPGILLKTATALDVLWADAHTSVSAQDGTSGSPGAWACRSRRPPSASSGWKEALQIAHQMWSGESNPVKGKHYLLEEAMNNPPAISRPRPPIMVGGRGEKKTLRLVAQYADACNLFAYGGAGTIRHKLEVLKHHCEDVGRDYEGIERTALGTVNLGPKSTNPHDVIGMCRDLSEAGIQHLIFNMPNVHEISPLETFGGEIIPAVAAL